MAGRRVSDASMVRATTKAADRATPYRKVTWRANMPSRAMHTVRPANRTARPEVLRAVTAASSGVAPDKKLAAVAAHDEQGVVDSHAQRHQGGQDGAELRDGEDMGQEADDGDADADRHQRRYEREQRTEERPPEGEEQDDQREQDAQAFAGRLAGSLVVLDGVAAELYVEDCCCRRTERS